MLHPARKMVPLLGSNLSCTLCSDPLCLTPCLPKLCLPLLCLLFRALSFVRFLLFSHSQALCVTLSVCFFSAFSLWLVCSLSLYLALCLALSCSLSCSLQFSVFVVVSGVLSFSFFVLCLSFLVSTANVSLCFVFFLSLALQTVFCCLGSL